MFLGYFSRLGGSRKKIFIHRPHTRERAGKCQNFERFEVVAIVMSDTNLNFYDREDG